MVWQIHTNPYFPLSAGVLDGHSSCPDSFYNLVIRYRIALLCSEMPGGLMDTLLDCWERLNSAVSGSLKHGYTATGTCCETSAIMASSPCQKQHQPHSFSPAAGSNARDALGDTELIAAARDGRQADCAKILHTRDPKAEVKATNKAGGTALMAAAQAGKQACIILLLQHIPQLQVAAANKDGATALMLAAGCGHAECVRQLLQYTPGAQVAATATSGRTALASAVHGDHPDCVALLLAHSPSAQIAALDGSGQTVPETAARLGRPQCLDLLLAHNPLESQHLDAAWLSALRQWDATQASPSPHARCLERLLAKGALLPLSAQESDKAKNRLFIQGFGSRALAANRTNEAIVGLALNVRGHKG